MQQHLYNKMRLTCNKLAFLFVLLKMKAILIIILLFANSAQAQNYSKTPGSIDLIFMSKALNNVAISNDLNKISSIEN